MDYRKTRPGVTAYTGLPAGGRVSGFTLIEMVVAIVVLGVLTSLVAVNWASFMRHQELRESALSLHKEILALKGRAIEQNDTAKFEGVAATGFFVTWRVDEEGDNDPAAVTWPRKAITLNKDVTISTEVKGSTNGLTPMSGANGWAAQGGKIEIVVLPNAIEAYDVNPYATIGGRIFISSASAKGAFCIQKELVDIRPTIYYRSKESGSWSKM